VSLYEALSGKVPFVADSPLALLRQIVEVDPPDLGKLKPDVDPEIRTIVARMMAKDRDLRVSSCAELIGGLEKFLESKGVSGSLVERVAASARGAAPPPPGNAADADLDSQPTRQVSGDALAGGAPALTAPAVQTEVPVVETSPLEEPPTGSGKRLALVAAAVVLFGLAAVVAAGILAWRSGLFEAAMGGRSAAAVTDTETPLEIVDSTAQVSTEQVVDEGETNVAAGLPASTTAAPPIQEPLAQAKAVESEVESGIVGRDSEPRQAAAATGPRTEAKREPALPPPPVRPPPEGTVVIAVGETVLASEAETVVEDALARAGVTLVDENGIPGIASFLGTDLAPEPGEVHGLLRPYAAHLVLVRVEYLGERPLVYMGQSDVAFQARIVMVPIDLQAGNAIAQPIRLRTEYTHLNAQRVAEKELRRPAHRFAQLLAGR
jgi:hypothetical protein